MPKFLHSHINLSGTRAVVTDPLAGQALATVRRREKFWEATCAQTGALLLPPIAEERPADHKRRFNSWGKIVEAPTVTLGEVLRNLRPVLCH